MSAPGELLVYTFKEGVFSKVAHDLKLRVAHFEWEEQGPFRPLRLTLRADALRVECAMEGGQEAPGTLGRFEKGQIEKHLREDVLHAERYPEIQFQSTDRLPGAVAGRLTLHGVTRELRVPYREEGGHRVAEVTLDQRDFGITPYRALLGALKVQPQVKVVARLPLAPSSD